MMKKLISFLTAAAMTVSCGAAASASGFVKSMNTAEANGNTSIDIIYNGQLLEYTDAIPENIDGRVMLPFRTVLEQIGAQVDYDSEMRLITASRGGITIKFTPEDDTIYVDNNGKSSEIKMDIPIVIKNDRTLVPVRFMSNAFGMQVGWNGEYNAVFVVDKEAYAEDFAANAPNMMLMAEMTKYDYNKSDVDIAMDYEVGIGQRLSLAMDFGSEMSESTSYINGKISADIEDMGILTLSAKDANLEMIAADGKVYIKTDLLKQLLSGVYGLLVNDELKGVIESDEWFYFDVEKLINELLGEQIPEEIKDLYIKALRGDLESLKNMQMSEMIASVIAAGGDATLESAMRADMVIDAYKAIDKYITVTDNKVEMKITIDEFIEMLNAMGISEIMSPGEMNELKDLLAFDMYAVNEYGDNEVNSKLNVKFNIKNGLNQDVKFNFEMTETDKKEEGIASAKIPENAVDLLAVAESMN